MATFQSARRPKRRPDESASTRFGLRLTFIGAVTAAIAAATLSACGPHDDTVAPYTAGGAAAVAPAVAAQSVALPPEAVPVPLRGQPMPPYAPPAFVSPPPTTVAAAPSYAPRYDGVAPPPAVRQAAPAAQPVNTQRLGRVEHIEAIRTRPQGSGAGAVIGGVLGAVVGNQFGHGGGRAVMTGAGAVGGAIAGNNLERNHREGVAGYRIAVRLDNGTTRTFRRTQLGDLHVGDRVRLEASSFRRV